MNKVGEWWSSSQGKPHILHHWAATEQEHRSGCDSAKSEWMRRQRKGAYLIEHKWWRLMIWALRGVLQWPVSIISGRASDLLTDAGKRRVSVTLMSHSTNSTHKKNTQIQREMTHPRWIRQQIGFLVLCLLCFKLRDHLSFAVCSLEVLSMALTMLLQFQTHELLSQQTTAIQRAIGKVLCLRIARQEFKSSHTIILNRWRFESKKQAQKTWKEQRQEVWSQQRLTWI